MRRIIFKLMFFTPIPILIAAVNYLADPANLFRGDSFEKQVAGIMLEGKNALIASNGDERLIQEYYIRGTKERKDIVVLGSSRSLVISGSFFPGDRFFNNSVSGGTIEDYMAIYGIYSASGYLPKAVVLAIDPWILNPNCDERRWNSVSKFYLKTLDRVNGGRCRTNKFPVPARLKIKSRIGKYLKLSQLFSVTYFQASLQNLAGLNLTGLGERRVVPVSGTQDSDLSIRMHDGSYVYDRQYRNKDVEGVRVEAVKYISANPVYLLGKFYSIDLNRLRLLECFVSLLKENNIKVAILLIPYHPVVYDYFNNSKDYKVVNDVEACLRGLAGRTGSVILGSYDPEKAGANEGDYYDGMHIKPVFLKKIGLSEYL